MVSSPIKVIDIAALILLSMLWGSSFAFIKMALEVFGPVTVASIRIFTAAFTLWLVIRLRGKSLPRDFASWKTMFLAGFAATTLPYVMISWGQQHIDSSTSAILMAFTPMVTSTLAHLMTQDEKMSSGLFIAILFGFAGVFVLFDGGNFSLESKAIQGQLMILMATFGYAISNILIRKSKHLEPDVNATGVMIASAILIIPVNLIFDPFWHYSYDNPSFLSAVYLGIISSGFATLLMVRIIYRRGVTFMSFNNFMLPFFSLLWGVLFLNEQIQMNSLLALALILLGLAIMIAVKKRVKA